MAIIVKNLTASGVEIPDLSGITIGPYGQADLQEFFTIDEIDDSEDLDNYIINNILIMNNGIRDLTKEESLEHTKFWTIFEIPKTFLDLLDTPTTYSGHSKYIVTVIPTESGVKFTNVLSNIGFDTTVSGVYPVEDYDLATKGYVDDIIGANGALWFSHFINDTPSKVVSIFGKSANGFNPGYDIRILELHVQFYSEHATESSLRVECYRYDANADLDRLLMSITDIDKPVGYHVSTDITPDTNYYDLNSGAGDTLWLRVDDGYNKFPKKVAEMTISVKYNVLS